MEYNGNYIHTLHTIRERIQTLNTKLSTYKAPVETSLLTSGVDSNDKALIEKCQKKTESMQFVASVNEFSFHWETMTSDQHKKYIEDYVETEYSAQSNQVQKEIIAFIVNEIVNKKSGFKHVRWNGYFIEHIPEVDIQHNSIKTNDEEEHDTKTNISVSFKKHIDVSQENKKTNTKLKHTSFNVMRSKLQREKKSFYA